LLPHATVPASPLFHGRSITRPPDPIADMSIPATAPTSSAAIISLIAGILAWLVMPLIGALAAVIAGHIARSEIRQSAGAVQGDGLAVAGLVLGYLQFALSLLGILLFAAVIGGIVALGAWGP
jgi:hypothetical protein